MTFWQEVLAIFIGDVFASALIVLLYVGIQWFLRATDVKISYNWSWNGPNVFPNFDIRNRSGSITYFLANVAYKRDNKTIWIDNDSLWDVELRPGAIKGRVLKVKPVQGIETVKDALRLEVEVRLQNGTNFWRKGTGPGQLQMGRIQTAAFWLRDKVEKAAITLE